MSEGVAWRSLCVSGEVQGSLYVRGGDQLREDSEQIFAVSLSVGP